MRALRGLQLAKNGAYRLLGEATERLDGLAPDADRRLRVLMYHKVNDLWPNPLTIPTAVFAAQMERLEELEYTPVSLDAVRDHYLVGAPLPPRPVLITFDDGYRDNLLNALPILRRHGFPAVVFVPTGFLGDSMPLPHEETMLELGVRNPTLSWEELVELEEGGIRIESHGVSHRTLATISTSDALREIVISKATLEDRLGREIEAFAYVRGSLADFRPDHASLVQQAGYKLAFTALTGSNPASADRYQLRRYNVEPYRARTFELVLAGACDLMYYKDTVGGTHVRRAIQAALGTATR